MKGLRFPVDKLVRKKQVRNELERVKTEILSPNCK
jgi:hypothetical protein